MKVKLGIIGLGMLLAAGCQQNAKTEAQPSALDVTTPTAQPMPVAQPMAQPIPAETTATPMMASSATLSGNSYTVKQGDTLWRIAAAHYGDGKKWKAIVDANPGLEPSKLRVGQTITLPAGS